MPDVSRLLTTGIRPHCDNCHCPVRVRPPRPWVPRADALPHRRFVLFLLSMLLGTRGPQDGALSDPRAKPFEQPKSHAVRANKSAAKPELLRSAHLLHCRYVVLRCQDEKNPLLIYSNFCRGSRLPFQRLTRAFPVAMPNASAPFRPLIIILFR